MDIKQYISEKYENKADWFIDEVKDFSQQQRVNKVMNIADYLDGKHKILQRASETYQDRVYEPRKIILNHARTILRFHTAFLLKNGVTLAGDEDVVNEMKKVYRNAKYARQDYKLLEKVIKYGSVYEYVYLDENRKIKSKIIEPAHGYPVKNEHDDMICFIEAWMNDGIDYYTVYYENKVEQYDNNGGEMRLTGEYSNLSGLPIEYKQEDYRSDVEDISNLVDNLEDLISKYTDSVYKHVNPLYVSRGQAIKNANINPDIVGAQGVQLDYDSDLFTLENKLDEKSFDSIYQKLMNAVLDVSSTPAISMNKTDISNLSEVSIKLLFSLAENKSAENEMIMREGFEQRFEKIRRLLEYKGIVFDDDAFSSLDVVFRLNRPSNDLDVVEILEKLNGMNAISLESILENSPMTTDVGQEVARLKKDSVSSRLPLQLKSEVDDENAIVE